MFDSIRRWFLLKKIKEVGHTSKLTGRNHVNPALKIAILFDGTLEEDRKTIHRLKKKLSTGDRQVSTLAFVNNKLPLDNVDYAAYNLKDVNWYGMPYGEKTETFINTEYDVMLAFIKTMEPHFEFIFATCKSKILIGPSVRSGEKYFHHITETNTHADLQKIVDDVLTTVAKVTI